ncbi:paired amphipathic helix protein Sin3b [Trichonephila clavipes]|nr:paired amphipathic helix protein Sin3b [Trichonephila clavipes]
MEAEDAVHYPVVFLNPPGVPPHVLNLKNEALIMPLRDLPPNCTMALSFSMSPSYLQSMQLGLMLSKITVVNDPSIASVYKFGTYEEHLFFDKVRAAVGYEEVYINFLRCLNLFTEDLVTRSELLEMCTPFLGPYPELLKQFKDMLRFKENGDNIEAIPQRIVDLENRRNEIENAADIDVLTRRDEEQKSKNICFGFQQKTSPSIHLPKW